MLQAGLDLSRKKVDVCLLGDAGEHLDQLVVPPDAGSLRTLARRIAEVHGEAVCAVIESMTGARIVHDTVEAEATTRYLTAAPFSSRRQATNSSARDTAQTVSQNNVEVLRTAYAQATARGIEGFLEFTTEDIVWISDARFPGGGTHMGAGNVRRWLTKLMIYEEISVEVEEIIDLDDKALGITRWHAVPVDAPKVDWLWCHLVSFREGLISEAQSFLDKRSALQAAGLPE